ncbi:sensor histidine kinase [Vibrio sp. SCSIO 43137]|uniref:sensor histidine kinase n=1 Tax=Vibrio sp. SCSIO 43137 TaxID=3021011 RepID=UPI002308343F|nr:HAMP domain-containing sensor histidine kinase [Vibrio sp. SCSIO 43137]WCE32405.1 HAMP domain-containing sensor histidine kinase [Vibrio sp. SCSIO 43137]
MPSIKRDIYIFLFSLAIGLSVVYGLLMSKSYELGMNESAEYAFRYEVATIEKLYQKTGQLPPLPKGDTLQAYTDIKHIPAKYQNKVNWQELKPDTLKEVSFWTEEDYLYLYAFKYPLSGSDTTIYFLSEYSANQVTEITEKYPPESARTDGVGTFAGALILIVFILARLLIHRITSPFFKLSDWAKTLDLDQTPDHKNLRYQELNLLARQLSTSVKKQREVVEREEFFLRAASHEMRTPITIISASTEMLNRVSEGAPKSTQRAINRISRSVSGMRDTMTALLWLARENTHDLETESIVLKSLVDEVIHDHQHLISGKEIEIEINEEDKASLEREIPELSRIVIVNLLRNAIQHTESGKVEIQLSPSYIEISNPYQTIEQRSSTANINTVSFGIGLFLVEKICSKQGWQFKYSQNQQRFSASVTFSAH